MKLMFWLFGLGLSRARDTSMTGMNDLGLEFKKL